eukprot:2691596-Prymnesium_polylepis.1
MRTNVRTDAVSGQVSGHGYMRAPPGDAPPPPSPIPDPYMTDPRAVPAPVWCLTSAWDPARVVRASRTPRVRMFVFRVLVAR